LLAARPRPSISGLRLSRDSAIGIGAAALAVAAMVVDHLLEEDGGLSADPPGFAIFTAVALIAAAIVFGVVVPRLRAGSPERAAKGAFVCSLLAVVALVLALWLGLPFVLGGGAVALGLFGRDGERRRLATAAIAIGTLVVLLGTAGYVAVAVDKLG
jgi:alkylation response protein AidB-like acyl-CoA dehydrogenase